MRLRWKREFRNELQGLHPGTTLEDDTEGVIKEEKRGFLVNQARATE